MTTRYVIQIIEVTDYVIEAEDESEAYVMVQNCDMGKRVFQDISTGGIWELEPGAKWPTY